MGVLVNRKVTTAIASLVALLIVALNIFLLVQIVRRSLGRCSEHILVPLDGSRLAEAALPAAAYVAQAFDAPVTLLHIVERDPPGSVHGEHHLVSRSRGAELS